MGEGEETESAANEALRLLRHDIKNQLSNIFLAVEQLRFDLPEVSEDCDFYLNLIMSSSKKIDLLIKDTGQER